MSSTDLNLEDLKRKQQNEDNDNIIDNEKQIEKKSTNDFGFSSYSKVNPFAIVGEIKPSSTFSSSSTFGSQKTFTGGFGSTSSASSTTSAFTGGFGAATTPKPSTFTFSGGFSSTKSNPFSSVNSSSVPNPFVSIGSNQESGWGQFVKNQLNPEEAVKSELIIESEVKKVSRSLTPCSAPSQSPSLSSEKETEINAAESTTANENKPKENESQNEKKEDEEEEDEEENDEDFKPVEDDEISPYKNLFHESQAVKSGEENEHILYETRGKLFRLNIKTIEKKSNILEKIHTTADQSTPSTTENDNENKNNDENTEKKEVKPVDINNVEWVESGVGPLRIFQPLELKDKGYKSGRLVMRREEKKGGVGIKVILNVRLDRFISVARQSDKVLRIMCINYIDELGEDKGKYNTYTIRFKTDEECTEILKICQAFKDNDKPN